MLLNSYAIKECIVIRKRIPLAYFATVQSLDQEGSYLLLEDKEQEQLVTSSIK